MLEYILHYKLYVSYFFELIAALCGSYYLFKNKNAASRFKFFAWFLWFVFIVDIAGGYTIWNYFDNYQTFPWLKDSVLVQNVWLYNCLRLITYLVVNAILINSLETSKHKWRLKMALLLFIAISVAEILFSGKFFISYIIENIFLGTLLLLICITAYFRNLLLSDNLLNFSKDLTFYIAVGYVVWNLCVTPIFIYQTYFTIENKEFILLYAAVIRFSNIFIYSLFSFAFIYCAQTKQLSGLANNKST